jgi:hypothetical protein
VTNSEIEDLDAFQVTSNKGVQGNDQDQYLEKSG